MVTFLYILGGIVLLIVILALIAPKNYHVYRSIVIDRPRAEVFRYVKFLRNQEAWSPWEERDPDMKKEFRGVDGEPGAVSYWKGNKQVGEGEQEIKRVAENERIETELRFFKPWKSVSDSYIKLEDTGANATKVSWGFSGKSKFPSSIFMLFMNIDKAIGKDFDQGLQKLKVILESHPQDTPPM